jgi:mycothiol synthase
MQPRTMTADDIHAVVNLMRACDVHDVGSTDVTVDDVTAELRRPGFTAVVVEDDEGGRLVGHAWVLRRGSDADADVYVLPDHRDSDVERSLLQWAQDTAAATGARELVVYALPSHAQRLSVMADEGFVEVRRYWHMERPISAEDAIVVAAPAGVTIRAYRHPEEARRFHAVREEGFAEHFRHREVTFDDWETLELDRQDFDPTLWWVAEAEDHTWLGLLYARYDAATDAAYVTGLTVLAPFRGRGIDRGAAAHRLRRVRAPRVRQGDALGRCGQRDRRDTAVHQGRHGTGLRVDRPVADAVTHRFQEAGRPSGGRLR